MAQLSVARWNRAVLAVAIETTFAESPTFTAANLILARNVEATIVQQMTPDDRLTGLVTRLPDIPGTRHVEIRGEAFVRGAGSAYSASVRPEIDALLRACGHSATVDTTAGQERVTYAPLTGTTMGETVRAAIYTESAGAGAGPRVVTVAAHGTGRFISRVGEPTMFEFRLVGLYSAPTNETLLTASIPSVAPPPFKGAAITPASWSVTEMTLDLGATWQLDLAAESQEGFRGVFLADRRPTLTADPQYVALATYDPYTLRNAATAQTVQYQVGAAQYNRMQITANAARVIDVRTINRNGIRAYRLELLLAAPTTGDAYTIVFS